MAVARLTAWTEGNFRTTLSGPPRAALCILETQADVLTDLSRPDALGLEALNPQAGEARGGEDLCDPFGSEVLDTGGERDGVGHSRILFL